MVRAFMILLCLQLNAELHAMRQIAKSHEFTFSSETMHIRPEDRKLVFDAYRDIKTQIMAEHNCTESEISRWCTDKDCDIPYILLKDKYEKEVPLVRFWHALSGLTFSACALARPTFEARVAKCMSIPYVRESQTGLAVEALVKRLENALHDQEKPKIKKWSHKNISATKPFDFSILDAFQPDDLENVALMNREWRDHHEDPEYDHGAAKYWFADLDGDLERALKNAKSKLVYIGQMYNHSMQQHRAWQILYDWREYFSGSYE